jgi:hypothetical protein
MKTTKLLICAVAVVAALAAAKAKGQTLTANLTGFDPGLSVEGTVDNGSYFGNVDSGVLKFSEFDAFCVEPTQALSFPETLIYQVQSPSSLANSDTIARLVGGYLASAKTADDAAAVHWAIWEVTTESLSSASLLDGNVRISAPGNVALLANQYLANVSSYTPVALTYLTNSTRQDVVTWNVVPEPSSAGLAALAGLFLLRRRR